jgi:hypothetical protein
LGDLFYTVTSGNDRYFFPVSFVSALTTAGEITGTGGSPHPDGYVEQNNFDGYTPPYIIDAPVVDVHLVPSTEKPAFCAATLEGALDHTAHAQRTRAEDRSTAVPGRTMPSLLCISTSKPAEPYSIDLTPGKV